jgi:hypothetical protein
MNQDQQMLAAFLRRMGGPQQQLSLSPASRMRLNLASLLSAPIDVPQPSGIGQAFGMGLERLGDRIEAHRQINKATTPQTIELERLDGGVDRIVTPAMNRDVLEDPDRKHFRMAPTARALSDFLRGR